MFHPYLFELYLYQRVSEMTMTNQCNWCSDELAEEILDQSTVMEVDAGTAVMNPGDPVEGAYILELGAVKLFRICGDGNRHVLYLLRKDGMCALSTLTSLTGGTMDILAEAEVPTKIRVLPKELTDRLFVENEEWRNMVLHSIRTSWQDSMGMLDQVAFKPLKGRLESYLQTHSQLSDRQIVTKSHAEIAEELYVSREAVSRTLKTMENEGMVRLGHGSIKVIDIQESNCQS